MRILKEMIVDNPRDERPFKSKTFRVQRPVALMIDDIRNMHKAGCWKFIPDMVVDSIEREGVQLRGNLHPKDASTLHDNVVIAIALKICWLYMMGANQYTRDIIRELHLLNGKPLRPDVIHRAANIVSYYEKLALSGEADESLSDDDFDFSDLDGI